MVGGGVGGGDFQHISVSPRPLGFGFGTKRGLGLRVWVQGSTILLNCDFHSIFKARLLISK